MRNKYKVGDKVRIRKDLKENKIYNDVNFVSEMKQFCGKVVEIADVYVSGLMSAYYIKEDEYDYAWGEEMFEPAITNFDKIREEIRIDEIDNFPICKAIHRMRREGNCYDRKCEECKEWLKQPYEEPEEILDKQEKEYLSFVIKPFRDKINCISKTKRYADKSLFYLSFDLKGNDYFTLPDFKEDTMYKGMEVEKEYTLEELGL